MIHIIRQYHVHDTNDTMIPMSNCCSHVAPPPRQPSKFLFEYLLLPPISAPGLIYFLLSPITRGLHIPKVIFAKRLAYKKVFEQVWCKHCCNVRYRKPLPSKLGHKLFDKRFVVQQLLVWTPFAKQRAPENNLGRGVFVAWRGDSFRDTTTEQVGLTIWFEAQTKGNPTDAAPSGAEPNGAERQRTYGMALLYSPTCQLGWVKTAWNYFSQNLPRITLHSFTQNVFQSTNL